MSSGKIKNSLPKLKMSCCDFKVSVVEQVTFVAHQKKVDDILEDLARKCKEVKVRAALQLRLSRDRVLVKIVPGKHEGCDSDKYQDELRDVLKHHCVKYQRQKVILVDFGDNAVKDLAELAKRLSCKVKVNAFYFDRCGNGVYQVSSVRKAKHALCDESSDDKCKKKCKSSSSSSSDDKCKKKCKSSSSSSDDCKKKKKHKKHHYRRHEWGRGWGDRPRHAPACDGAQ
jgi:hypothetical protein